MEDLHAQTQKKRPHDTYDRFSAGRCICLANSFFSDRVSLKVNNNNQWETVLYSIALSVQRSDWIRTVYPGMTIWSCRAKYWGSTPILATDGISVKHIKVTVNLMHLTDLILKLEKITNCFNYHLFNNIK